MKVFRFTEAQPLLNFIDSYSKEIIGHTIKKLYINFWPRLGLYKYVMSDEPVVLEMDNGCIRLEYLVISDLTIFIGSKEDLQQEERVDDIMHFRDEITDYFDYDDSVKKEDIEGQTVINVTVDRFSRAFAYTIQDDMRPKGGDYFLTIKLHLDNGMRLCFCGADAEADGYIFAWCENMHDNIDIENFFIFPDV